MPLETASFVNDLNSSNPPGTDLLKQGDDHIRLIKAVLLATFPNLDAAVTVTPAELNLLAGAISVGVPTGTICMWYGSAGSVPSGWHICDGTTAIPKSSGVGTIDAPDLRDKVVQGVGTLQATPGGAYGAATSAVSTGSAGDHSHTTTASGAHMHPGTSVDGHTLTVSEIPAHSHSLRVYDRADTDSLGSGGAGDNTVSLASGMTANYIENTGGGAAHVHTLTQASDGSHSHPTDTVGAHTHSVTTSTYQPAVALHYILKL